MRRTWTTGRHFVNYVLEQTRTSVDFGSFANLGCQRPCREKFDFSFFLPHVHNSSEQMMQDLSIIVSKKDARRLGPSVRHNGIGVNRWQHRRAHVSSDYYRIKLVSRSSLGLGSACEKCKVGYLH